MGARGSTPLIMLPPPPANLPTTRTEGSTAYQIIGVDYAGPLRYRKSKGKEGKAYILLYACSLTRGVFLDLMPNMEMTECLYSLQRFIARRDRPERIYSDNGSTFTAAGKWINDGQTRREVARLPIKKCNNMAIQLEPRPVVERAV